MLDFDAYYINLWRAEDRRKAIEANLDSVAFSPNLNFKRFEAIDASSHRVSFTRSSLSLSQTACFLSHMDCLGLSVGDNERHVIIAEDDVFFSSKTKSLLNEAIESLSDPWDIICTNIIVFKANMAPLLFFRQNLIEKHTFSMINLTKLKMGFAGATCYVVNKFSKEKVYNILNQHNPMEFPLDVLLRNEIRSEQLQAYCIFPFITSISSHAETTQIPLEQPLPASNHALWNYFRRQAWIDVKTEDFSLENLLTLWHTATN